MVSSQNRKLDLRRRRPRRLNCTVWYSAHRGIRTIAIVVCAPISWLEIAETTTPVYETWTRAFAFSQLVCERHSAIQFFVCCYLCAFASIAMHRNSPTLRTWPRLTARKTVNSGLECFYWRNERTVLEDADVIFTNRAIAENAVRSVPCNRSSSVLATCVFLYPNHVWRTICSWFVCKYYSHATRAHTLNRHVIVACAPHSDAIQEIIIYSKRVFCQLTGNTYNTRTHTQTRIQVGCVNAIKCITSIVQLCNNMQAAALSVFLWLESTESTDFFYGLHLLFNKSTFD